MVTRSIALCDDKIIGIESIYTIIDHKQIYIPEKITELRQKSREKKLFCPCGCGTNLILVAGDKQLVSQHFREAHGSNAVTKCKAVEETQTSINSKVVLRCWLCDKLATNDIESRVTAKMEGISKNKRLPELTFLADRQHIGIRYWRLKDNSAANKIDILENLFPDINIFYITDHLNDDINGQYPERLMHMQKKQGFCLFLQTENDRYHFAKMKASLCLKNADKLWEEVFLSEGCLEDYSLENGGLFFKDVSLKQLAEEKTKAFQENAEQIIQARLEQKRQEEERKRLEKQKRLEERKKREEQKRAEEIRKAKEKKAKKEQLRLERQRRFEEQMRLEEERRRLEEEQLQMYFLQQQKRQAEKAKQEAERKEQERIRLEKIRETTLDQFSQHDYIVTDNLGNRIVKCEICGMIGYTADFGSYGGVNHINLGICERCHRAGLAKRQEPIKKKQNICPLCGHDLKQRNGQFGPFLGCSNYPKCKFTRKLYLQ